MRKLLYALYAWPMAIGYLLLLFTVGFSRAIAGAFAESRIGQCFRRSTITN